MGENVLTRSIIRRPSALTAFFAFIPLAASGLVMLLWPDGGRGRGFGGAGRGIEFLGLDRGDWSEFHEIAGIIFLTAALIHLACNWSAMKRHLGVGSTQKANGGAARDYL